MKVLIARSDGGVSIMTLGNSTDIAASVAKWQSTFHTATALYFRTIEDEDLPASGAFRNAWKDDGSRVVVDMPEARNIKWRQLEEQREALIGSARLNELHAQEVGSVPGQARWLATRVALRSMTFSLAGILNAAALEKYSPPWPEGAT